MPANNLLTNPSFEQDWVNDEDNAGHEVLVLDRDTGGSGTVYHDNIFNPPGWKTWYFQGQADHDPQNDVGYSAPEVKAAEARNPDRFLTGRRGLLLFTFSRIHDAGLMQTVKVEKGSRFMVQAFAHAWSNAWSDNAIPDHEDDPGWSEGAGYDAVAIPYGQTSDDELMNFLFQVGVDPLGGQDPRSQNVIWSRGEHIYNSFSRVGPLEVAAEADQVTVFLRSRCLWPYKHNDAYWDDASLVVVEEPDPPKPPDPPEPEPSDAGSKIGVHGLQSGRILEFTQRLVDAGTYFRVVKAVDEFGWLKEVKRWSPNTTTIGRITSPLEGVGGVHDDQYDAFGLAKDLVDLVSAKIEDDPELGGLVDYWEICNEPLGGGVSSEIYARLAEVMMHCMIIAEDRGLKLGLFAFNAGTPEWADMVAMADTGVFGLAKEGGHIITLHEGVFEKEDPIDKFYQDYIPGAPHVPHAGALCFRYRYLLHLMEQRNQTCPIVVTEWYPGGDPEAELDIRMRYLWYDDGVRSDFAILGFCPFTLGAAYGWEHKNQERYFDMLLKHMIEIQGEPNAPSDPSPGRGQPREQYSRTYVLLPPGAGESWAQAVVNATWAHRYTVGGSADDAGIGDLDVRRVIAVNPSQWGPGGEESLGRGILGFFERFYPGVDARQVLAGSPSDLRAALSERTFDDLDGLAPYNPPAPDPEPDPVSRGLLGLHMQNEMGGWRWFVEHARPPVMVVFQAEIAQEIKRLSPGTLVLWRHWIDGSEQERLLTLSRQDVGAAVEQYLDKFAESLGVHGEHIDYTASLNEMYSYDDARTQAAAEFDARFCYELAALDTGVKPGVLAGPVGYPANHQVELIRPAVEAVCQTDGVILYHGYYMVHNGESLIASRWLLDAGLFLDVHDRVFTETWNCHPKYFQVEAGPVGSWDGATWDATAGWRHHLAYRGDIDALIAGLAALQDRWHEWNSRNNNRFLGATLFTSGQGVGWEHFIFAEPQMKRIFQEFYEGKGGV